MRHQSISLSNGSVKRKLYATHSTHSSQLEGLDFIALQESEEADRQAELKRQKEAILKVHQVCLLTPVSIKS